MPTEEKTFQCFFTIMYSFFASCTAIGFALRLSANLIFQNQMSTNAMTKNMKQQTKPKPPKELTLEASPKSSNLVELKGYSLNLTST